MVGRPMVGRYGVTVVSSVVVAELQLALLGH